MQNAINCGEATIRLLAKYGVSTVFGIPGVHTLDFCRGLDKYGVRHVQARNEQGAGFMAEGYARARGQPGVALVISGPGVTNAATALAQCYADSIPMILLSAEPASHTIGKGWGVLHEVTEQKRVTEPLTAFSETVRRPSDIPLHLGQAFSMFKNERPRPVHISVPIDIQAETVTDDWEPVNKPSRGEGNSCAIPAATDLLGKASFPIIMVGGGAINAKHEIMNLAQKLDAIVISSTAGKGIVPESYPLNLGASTVRSETRDIIAKSDCVLAIGTELSETDSFVERLEFNGRLIRVDIDSSKINDFYSADVGVVDDASTAAGEIMRNLLDRSDQRVRRKRISLVHETKQKIFANLTDSERQHACLLRSLRSCTSPSTIFAGDACQLVYTGAFMMEVEEPRKWFYPAGYCALGCALPNAIGAKLALPDNPVVVLAGDGGFMFTMPEIMVARDLELTLPIIIWTNGGLKQIQDDLDARGIHRTGVEGSNPDFVALAKACSCHGVHPQSADEFENAVTDALARNVPTVIEVTEGDAWLRRH